MLTAVALSACTTLVAGCGGGSRQDAGEPSGTFTVQITRASFPVRQAVSRQAVLLLKVRNAGVRTIPNIAITLDSFNYASTYPELAADKRPIWVVERGPGVIAKHPVESETVAPPGGGQTAYVETWALGPLAPGATQTFRWRVTPVKAGIHTVHFTVAAGLAGKAKARLPSGAIPHGRFTALIAPRPPATYVNPNTGKVVPGTYPPSY
ncbi:MAG TPA: hypothetical protein VES65_05820 [Solirubrobacteraceae bacterium]|nr:hypothetical protein [Solirubrobacteraceae bacterium]